MQALHLIDKHDLTSIPVVDAHDKYVGIIFITDIRFIVQNDRLEWLFLTCQKFLELLYEEKKQILACNYFGTQFLEQKDGFLEVIEKILFAEGERLVELDDNKKILRIITLTDIFNYYLTN